MLNVLEMWYDTSKFYDGFLLLNVLEIWYDTSNDGFLLCG